MRGVLSWEQVILLFSRDDIMFWVYISHFWYPILVRSLPAILTPPTLTYADWCPNIEHHPFPSCMPYFWNSRDSGILRYQLEINPSHQVWQEVMASRQCATLQEESIKLIDHTFCKESLILGFEQVWYVSTSSSIHGYHSTLKEVSPSSCILNYYCL